MNCSHAACVSPRTFWNIVRVCGVGPNKTFEQALKEILPNADWNTLLSRTQHEKEEGFYRVAAGGRATSSRARKSPKKKQIAEGEDVEQAEGADHVEDQDQDEGGDQGSAEAAQLAQSTGGDLKMDTNDQGQEEHHEMLETHGEEATSSSTAAVKTEDSTQA